MATPLYPLLLASPLVALARGCRTLLFQLLGPGEAALRRLRGQPALPPLWLRRHVGPLRSFESAARETAATLDRLDLVRPDGLVLDLGCGCGAMVPAFAERLGPEGRYLGVDVHGPSIRWCRGRWAADGRLRFELARFASPYADAPNGRPDPAEPSETFRLPLGDAGVHLVLAKSLFTHLLKEEARLYLAEIRRVLAQDGRALVTVFLFGGGSVPPAFPWPEDPAAPVRWRLAARPHAAVAYERGVFEDLLAASGLEVETFLPGFWPGTDQPPRGQDTVVLRASDPKILNPTGV